MMLAIEISQRFGSVALRAEHGTIHVEQLSTADGKSGRHGDDLMPAVDRLFARLDLPPTAMESVAVSIGPGSFTGLRIAVTTAKMFAQTLSARIVAVPSALVAAENLPGGQATEQILVALAGKRETIWATRLRREAGQWLIAGEPGIVEAGSVDLAGIGCVLADSYVPEALRERCEARQVRLAEPRFDASACLRVGERLASAGRFVDPLALLPLYPRRPEAATIWEERQKKSQPSR